MGVVLPGANSLTVPLPALATNRLPLESNARRSGIVQPGEGGGGVVLPGANSLTVLLPVGHVEVAAGSRTPGRRDQPARRGWRWV